MKTGKLLSRFRKVYLVRFLVRCAVFVAAAVLVMFAPSQFKVLRGFGFFRKLSVLHLLWLKWMIDMILQLCPSRRYWPLGSQKFLKACFQPIVDKVGSVGLLEYIKKCNRDTLQIGLLWLAMTLVIGGIYAVGLIGENMLLIISVAFYVCDLICVLFWCPFRVWLMKNRCCTTCRIFNWDHMMMFSPLFFIPGVYTWSLCVMALVVFLVWEITFTLHPERFWDGSNEALRCANCTDRLCGERNCRVDIPSINNLKM